MTAPAQPSIRRKLTLTIAITSALALALAAAALVVYDIATYRRAPVSYTHLTLPTNREV